MSLARALYQLQILELRQRQVEQRLREIAAALAHEERVAGAQKKITNAKERLQPLLTRQRELEHDLAANEAKARATDDRLYSGAVSNPKELADMQQELAALRRRRDQLEEELLVTMEMVERAEEGLAGAEERLREAEKVQTAENTELIQERAELMEERGEMMEQCDAALASIAAEPLARYRALSQQKRGRALSPIREGRCAACGVSLSTGLEQRVRHGIELVACHNCGRLLVAG